MQHTQGEPSRRRGIVVVVVAISVTTLLLVGALAVDVSYIGLLVAEAQNTADAGALAGAVTLRTGSHDEVRERVAEIINQNHRSQGFSAPEDQVIQIGRWDKATQTFTETSVDEASIANAVRVVAVRNNASLFFAALAGRYKTDVSREAVASFTPACKGIWGLNWVKVPGSVAIDSYDSTEGAYSPGRENGDLCSNGQITVSGSADVHGDARASDVVLSGGSVNVTGTVEDAQEYALAPGIGSDFYDAITSNDNGTIGLTDLGNDPLDNTSISRPGTYDLILTTNENLTLQPGTYFFDDIQMDGDSSLTITGPTTIYLDDDLQMAGTAILNTTMDTTQLTIIADGDSDGSVISISGSAEFYGTIFAPNSAIELNGTADYYGALIGRSVKFAGNFTFHLDESLPLPGEMQDKVMLVR